MHRRRLSRPRQTRLGSQTLTALVSRTITHLDTLRRHRLSWDTGTATYMRMDKRVTRSRRSRRFLFCKDLQQIRQSTRPRTVLNLLNLRHNTTSHTRPRLSQATYREHGAVLMLQAAPDA